MERLVGAVTLDGPNSPSLNLARKLFRGTATPKEKDEYMIHYASPAERRLGKAIAEMNANEFLQYSVLSENLKEGNLEGGDCKICKNKGLVYGIHDGLETVKECECMESRRAKKVIELSEYAKYITSKTFENFEIVDEVHKYALRQAKNYIKQSKYPFLFVGGTTGTGKTHLTVATFFQLTQQGYLGEFVKWEQEFNLLMGERTQDTVAYRKRMAKLKYTPLLLIDDFLWNNENAKPTAFEYKTAKEIIDERSLRGLRTIFSSNYTLTTLFNSEPVVGGRINEFSGGSKNFAIELSGKNFRLLEKGQMELTDEELDF